MAQYDMAICKLKFFSYMLVTVKDFWSNYIKKVPLEHLIKDV